MGGRESEEEGEMKGVSWVYGKRLRLGGQRYEVMAERRIKGRRERWNRVRWGKKTKKEGEKVDALGN